MSLTDAQAQTLANHLGANTDQAVIDAITAGATQALADLYNEEVSPDFWILKPDINVDEAVEALDWATDYAAFKDDIPALEFVFRNGSFATEGAGGRNALNQILSGANNSKNALLNLATEKASVFKKIFAVAATGPGGGDGSAQAQSATAVVNRDATRQDMQQALPLIP